MPPLKALVRGVRMARVITTSSGFFWVLRVRLVSALDLWKSNGHGLHGGEAAFARCEVAKDGVQSFGSHDEQTVYFVQSLRRKRIKGGAL